ncbi:MAG: hypothetical protein ACP5JJ_09580 [Anaerolineae bacterium]
MIRPVHPVKDPFRAAIITRSSWQAFVGLALAGVVFLGLLALLGHRGYDDPYITFRYAQNLLAGRGFVYNAGQRILSTTAPLYAFVLAGLGSIWEDLPAVANILGLASLMLGAVFLGALTWQQAGRASGLMAALLLSLSPDLLSTLGSESCMVIMLILGGFLAYSRSRHMLAAALLALAVLVRPDAVLAFVAVGICHLVRRESIPWRAVWLWVGIVGVWYAALWLYFGSPLPVTLQAKQQQGRMDISEPFALGLVNLVRNRLRQPIYWLAGLLGLAGLGRVVTHRRVWMPLLVWTALYVVAYSLLGVSRYFWYFAPLAPAFAVLVAEGAEGLLTLAAAKLPDRWVQGGTGLLVVALMAPLVQSTVSAGWNTDPRPEVYEQVGRWLKTQTEPESTVGALEIGIIGYYAERTMVDFAGLLQPDISQQLTKTGTYQDSTAWAIQHYTPDYVVLYATGFSQIRDSEWFQSRYGLVQRFNDARGLHMELFVQGGH